MASFWRCSFWSFLVTYFEASISFLAFSLCSSNLSVNSLITSLNSTSLNQYQLYFEALLNHHSLIGQLVSKVARPWVCPLSFLLTVIVSFMLDFQLLLRILLLSSCLQSRKKLNKSSDLLFPSWTCKHLYILRFFHLVNHRSSCLPYSNLLNLH